MNRKIGIVLLVAALLFAGVSVAAAKQAGGYQYQNTKDQQNSQPGPNGDGLMQQIRNRFCDMLGICQGGCNLSDLTGTLTNTGNYFYIDDVELHFGPIWYITSAESSVDYDNDGQFELIIDELLGLVGTTVTVQGHYQSDNWMSVFTINGEVYREPGQPVWAWTHEWHWRNGNQNGGQP